MNKTVILSVYTNIKESTKEEYDFECYIINNNWIKTSTNLLKTKYYKGDLLLEKEFYSYNVHDRFQAKLIKLIRKFNLLDEYNNVFWYKVTKDMPFYMFLDFPSNKGAFDCEISEMIYNDFEKNKEEILKNRSLHVDKYFIKSYDMYLETFKLGQESGNIVLFKF
jgi:hypothetical protein